MTKDSSGAINGILLIYHRVLSPDAATVMEHIDSFEKFSRFKVWKVNTELGYPKILNKLKFKIVVLHYSLFGSRQYQISDHYLKYIKECESSYKIVFFQDEYYFCKQRFAFLNEYKIDCIYTLLDPAYWKDVYEKYTSVPKILYTLTGYVSDNLIEKAAKMSLPDQERPIDVGYRGRQLPLYTGEGSQEKVFIAAEFSRRAKFLGLKLDITTREESRIYGNSWYIFTGSCKAFLGVEAGVSIFDLEDAVREEYERLLETNTSLEELSTNSIFQEWEGQIPYRTISPRHFEAAAFRTCQILFEGKYSGILQPMVHYIPLKKDFSNFDEVIRMFKNESLRHALTENAYRDLIASGSYSYKKFIENFDDDLLNNGFSPNVTINEAESITKLLYRYQVIQNIKGYFKALRYKKFPGRKVIVAFIKVFLK